MIDAVVIGRVGIDLYPNQLETPLPRCGRTRASSAASRATSRPGWRGSAFEPRSSRASAPRGTATSFAPGWPARASTSASWPPTRTGRRRRPSARSGRPTASRSPSTARPTAPDWQLSPDDFDAKEVAEAKLLYATGTGLAQSPSRETTLAALKAHPGTTIFDLDWRPTLWDEPDTYPALAAEAAAAADIVIGNEEEVEASGVTRRADRSSSSAASAARRSTTDGEETEVPGFPVEVVNGLGAGDAFAAALGPQPPATASRSPRPRAAATSPARSSPSRLACSEAMPRLVEIEGALV